MLETLLVLVSSVKATVSRHGVALKATGPCTPPAIFWTGKTLAYTPLLSLTCSSYWSDSLCT